MAAVAAVKIFNERNDVIAYEWVGLTESDTAEHVKVPQKSDKTMQVDGDFGSGGDVRVEGSLVPNADKWGQLSNPQGNAITFLSGNDEDVETILQNTMFIRPAVVGGTSVSVNVRILMS